MRKKERKRKIYRKLYHKSKHEKAEPFKTMMNKPCQQEKESGLLKNDRMKKIERIKAKRNSNKKKLKRNFWNKQISEFNWMNEKLTKRESGRKERY